MRAARHIPGRFVLLPKDLVTGAPKARIVRMRSAADLCFHNEQLPRPARKATYRRAGGWPRRKGPLDAPMTKTNPSKDLPHYCNNRCVTLLFPHVAAYLAGRVRRAVPSHQNREKPSGSQWLHEIKHDGFGLSPARRAHRRGSTAVPATHPSLPADRRDTGPPALALLQYRRRSGRLR